MCPGHPTTCTETLLRIHSGHTNTDTGMRPRHTPHPGCPGLCLIVATYNGCPLWSCRPTSPRDGIHSPIILLPPPPLVAWAPPQALGRASGGLTGHPPTAWALQQRLSGTHCTVQERRIPETTGKISEHAAHHRWVTAGDPEPPGPCVTFPTSDVVVGTLPSLAVLGKTLWGALPAAHGREAKGQQQHL